MRSLSGFNFSVFLGLFLAFLQVLPSWWNDLHTHLANPKFRHWRAWLFFGLFVSTIAAALNWESANRPKSPPNPVVPRYGLTIPAPPIPIELKTDKATYAESDQLVVTVQAAESVHLRLLYENAAGEVYTLFPNQFITDDWIEGGRPVKVMPAPNPAKPGDEVAVQITGPNFGAECLAAVVSDQPFNDDAVLKDELEKRFFARSTARSIEEAVTEDAQAVPGSARSGFARINLTTIKKQQP